MTEAKLVATIGVADKATGPLRKIAAQFLGLGAAAKAAAGQGEGLGGRGSAILAGLGSVAQGAGAAGRAVQGAATTIGISGIGLGAATAGLHRLAMGFAEAGGAADDAAQRVGVPVEKLQALEYQAKMSGASAELLQASLGQLNKRVGDAAAGKNQDVAALFRALGISVKDASGKVKPLADLMPQLAEAFKNNEDPALRTRMAMALFGDAGVKMIPMLAAGREEMERMESRARRLGVVMGEDAVRKAAEMGDAMDDLQFAMQGLRNTIGGMVAPVMIPMVAAMTDWVAVNREFIGQKLAETAQAVAKAFDGIDVGALIDGVGTLVSGFAAGINVISQVDGGLLALVPTMVALNAVMLANPAGLVVAGLAALVAVGVLVVNNWDSIVAAIGQGARAFLNFAAKVTPVGAAIKFMIENWADITKGFGEAWDTVGQAVGKLVDYVGGKVTALRDSLASLIEPIGRVGEFLSDNRLTRFAGSARDTVAGLFGGDDGAPPPDIIRPPAVNLVQQARPVPAYGGQAAGTSVNGEIRAVVELVNAPPGTRAKAVATGPITPEVNVGYGLLAAPR